MFSAQSTEFFSHVTQLSSHIRRRDPDLILLVHAFLYQARQVLPGVHLLSTPIDNRISIHFCRQVFLTQGLGAGIGAGIMYVPSLAVVSHYFHRRRAMAMSICSSGASLGAIIHPIMLNTTINGSLGFAKATRTSAGMVSVLLLIACAMMRTREPRSSQRPAELSKALRKFSRDGAYIISIIGYAWQPSWLMVLLIYFPT